METKKWYQSKMLWLNISAVVAAAGAILHGDITWQQAIPTTGLAVVNFILRLITGQPIE